MSLIALNDVTLRYSTLAFRSTSLKEHIVRALRPNTGRTPPLKPVEALKHFSLEVHDGERLGLIGHNGAGKSTLLKVIAGLYPIAEGSRVVEGTIRSLFDLSLGFEVEATGRENILYRGLLLGQAPKEMRSLEEEIIAFADLGEFIDYPVKTYSAGMLVRLAFAISTTVRGDVLLLDEVIGAGDAAFLDKARIRIQGLVESSRILVLASHDLAALNAMCTRAIVIDHGTLTFDGAVPDAISHYRRSVGLE